VDLVQAYSKRRDLADALVSSVQQLRQAQKQGDGQASSERSARPSSLWRIGDRLADADAEQPIVAFTAGTPKRQLAERYCISESSVKRLIRQHGASNRPVAYPG